jgi:hypothetical protein
VQRGENFYRNCTNKDDADAVLAGADGGNPFEVRVLERVVFEADGALFAVTA